MDRLTAAPAARQWVRQIGPIIGVALIYTVIARLSLLLAIPGSNTSPVWPPSGFAFAAILLLGYRVWPGVMAGAFIANLTNFLADPRAPLPALIIASGVICIGNTLETLAGAYLAHRLIGRRNPMERTQDVVKFTGITLAMCLIACTIGPSVLCAAGIRAVADYPELWSTWWQGDVSGILIVTPMLLAWSIPAELRAPSWRAAELATVLVLILALAQILFGGWLPTSKITSQAYLVIPLLLWVVFRFGQREAATAVTLVTALAIRGTVTGHGPFARANIVDSLLLQQSFISVITVTMMMLAAACAERNLAEHNLKSRVERESLLNRIGQALRSSLDPREIESVAITVLGESLKADRCFFIFLDGPGGAIRIEQDWRRGDLPSLMGTYGTGDFGDLNNLRHYTSGKPLVVDDVRTGPWNPKTGVTLEQLGMLSLIRVPLFDDGQLVATVGVAMAERTRMWTELETSLVEAVATQIRGAVEAASVHQREHNIAITLQHALQPRDLMKVPGLDLGHYYKAALEEANIGGDFYDVFPVNGGSYALVIGDVSGKGLAAAVQVATVRNMLRCVLYLGGTVTEAVTELNDILNEHELLAGFVTIFVGMFNPNTQELHFVSCGQEPGLLYRSDTADIEELEPTGPPLGVSEGIYYSEQVVLLSPGDTLLLYTDGVSEAGRNRSEMLGSSGIADIFRKYAQENASANQLVSSIMAEVLTAIPGPLRDDACLLAAVTGQARPAGAVRRVVRRSRLSDFYNEERRRVVYREVLSAVTGGKLILCDEQAIEEMTPRDIPITHPLGTAEDASALRYRLREYTAPSGRRGDVDTAITEAATNAVKHGGGGVAEAWTANGSISILISDQGGGICLPELARAIFEMGFSTSNSLGMGFPMMLSTADSLFVSTSAKGTSILLRIANTAMEPDAVRYAWQTA